MTGESGLSLVEVLVVAAIAAAIGVILTGMQVNGARWARKEHAALLPTRTVRNATDLISRDVQVGLAVTCCAGGRLVIDQKLATEARQVIYWSDGVNLIRGLVVCDDLGVCVPVDEVAVPGVTGLEGRLEGRRLRLRISAAISGPPASVHAVVVELAPRLGVLP